MFEQMLLDAKRSGGSYDQVVADAIGSALDRLLAPLRALMAVYIEKDAPAQRVTVTFAQLREDGRHASLSVSWGNTAASGDIKLNIALNLTGVGGSSLVFVDDVSSIAAAIENVFHGRRAEFRRFITHAVADRPVF